MVDLFGTTLSSDDFTTAGVVAAAVLAVLLVALSTYGRRRFSHPAVRLVVLGASTVYLALMSSVISSLQRKSTTEKKCDGTQPASGRQNPDVRNMWTLLLWIVLILTIKGNADTAAAAAGATAAVPAADDASIDGLRIRAPVEPLVQYAWLAYLICLCLPLATWLQPSNVCIFIVFSGLGLARTVLKLAVSLRASDSFALGKNARLVAGYMAQLVADGDGGGQKPVPRYIVTGERRTHVEESPDGYRVRRDVLEEETEVEEDRFSGLVTLDRVWRMAEHGDGILAGRRELRDLCLSYSLFKILRRRLSGYPLADAGSRESLEFVLRGMDSVGAGGAADAGRVFRVLVDELWFASDFYYSPIPLSIFNGWCAAVNCAFSVLIVAGAVAVGWIYEDKGVVRETPYKIVTYALLLAVVVVEAWEIVAGVSSNWTKMALLGHYIRRRSLWRRSGWVHAALAAVLRLRPATRWRDKVGQNSVLEPRRFRSRSGLLSFFTERFYGGAGLMRSVDVKPAVKDAVLRSLLSSYGRLSKGGAAARRVGGKVNWALYGSQKSWAWDGDGGGGNTDMILVWHIATTLFEMRSTTSASTPDMAAATDLSYYCAYLVAAAPELLPDCAAWTKKRYEEVSEDVRAALGTKGGGGGGGGSPAERYERLVQALGAGPRDAVVRRGAELGRQLVEQYGEDDEASAWRILADLWAEMVLYVAPSENVKGHVEAMARGGEFVTLVWALLLHAGVTTRPDAPGAAIP
ncbi:hypothetical protein ACP4OV_020717 [Aristida adscensionis]